MNFKGLSLGIIDRISFVHPLEHAAVQITHMLKTEGMQPFAKSLAAVAHRTIHDYRLTAGNPFEVLRCQRIGIYELRALQVAHLKFGRCTGIE